jgi:hypothetical protein
LTPTSGQTKNVEGTCSFSTDALEALGSFAFGGICVIHTVYSIKVHEIESDRYCVGFSCDLIRCTPSTNADSILRGDSIVVLAKNLWIGKNEGFIALCKLREEN